MGTLGYDFGSSGKSPYINRKNRVYGRSGGRPVGSTDAINGQSNQPRTDTGSGISSDIGQSPYAGFLKNLMRPITNTYQSQFKERANLFRGYTQGAYKTATEGMENIMGGKGFRAGESGFADTAIGRVKQAGAEELSRGYGTLAADEARREQESRMATAGLNLQRNLGGAGLALSGEEGAYSRLMDYYKTKLGAETEEWRPWWQGMASGY